MCFSAGAFIFKTKSESAGEHLEIKIFLNRGIGEMWRREIMTLERLIGTFFCQMSKYLQQIQLDFAQKVDPDNIYFMNLLSNHETTGH